MNAIKEAAEILRHIRGTPAEIGRAWIVADELEALLKQEPVRPDWFGEPCNDDNWYECPDDCNIIGNIADDPVLGMEFELDVSWVGVQRFRVIKIADESNDDVEVEFIGGDTLYAAPGSTEPVNQMLLDALKRCRFDLLNMSFDDLQFIKEAIAAAEAQQKEPEQIYEIRLFDSQWTNVVNHNNCYAGYSVEDAVSNAVKLTEVYMAKNFRDDKWPTERELNGGVE